MKPRSLLLLLALPLLAGCAKKPETPHELYAAYCARCHGENGEGNPRAKVRANLDLLASSMVRRGDRALIHDRIARGKGPMPGFARRLSPGEIESLVDFTIELQRKAGD